MFQAWQSGRFARLEKLKPLQTYLAELKPTPMKGREPDEMLAVLRALQSGGAPITIRRLN